MWKHKEQHSNKPEGKQSGLSYIPEERDWLFEDSMWCTIRELQATFLYLSNRRTIWTCNPLIIWKQQHHKRKHTWKRMLNVAFLVLFWPIYWPMVVLLWPSIFILFKERLVTSRASSEISISTGSDATNRPLNRHSNLRADGRSSEVVDPAAMFHLHWASIRTLVAPGDVRGRGEHLPTKAYQSMSSINMY